MSLKLPNGFDPSLLRRPSLETLLKEAQSENKTSESKSEKEEGGPSDSENKEKPKETEKNSNKTEESNNEKKPEKSEESKTQNESNPAEKRPENSTSKEEGKEKASESSSKSEEKPSKEANESVTSSSDKRPEESSEREKEKEEASQSKEGQSESPVDEKASGEEKEKSGSPEKQKPTGGNENKEEGSSNKESPPEKEKEKNESPENMKQSEKQESSASSEKEVPSSGSSEREEKESSSTEKEHSPSGSSEKPLKESSSSEQGKMSESAVKEKEESKSSEKEAPTSGSSNEENPPEKEKEKEKNKNPENMKQSEKQESSASSEKEVPSSGPSEREEKESSSTEKEHSPSGSSLKESSSSEQGKMSESAVKEKEDSKSSEKEAPTNNEQSSSSEKENPVNNPKGQEKEESSSENTQESNNMKTPSESDLVASIRLKQGRIFIEPQQPPQQLQSTDSASQGGRPEKIKENVQANVVPEVASQSNTVTQNQPSNVQANEKTNSNPSITPGEADKVDGVKPKPLIPFDSLLSRINQALGLDSPQSKLKVSSIALASKANSSFHGQPLNDINGNTHKIAVDVPEFISNDQRVPQSNFVKIGQFWLNHGRPMGNSSGTSGFRSHENNGMSSNIQQHVVSNNTPGGDTRLSHSGSLTDMVDDSQSGSPTRLHQEGGSPVMGKITHPAITHSSCTDTGERCPLWQKRGYCSNVQYADFMKRHCTSTCGYCAFPSVQIQSERANDIGNAFHNHECKDSQSYAEFSCPAWKAQGYCQKKEKQMKLFCRSTCNFCKRKTIKKKSKHHDEQSKSQPSTNPKYSDGNFAHAQTGDNAGKHIATAHTGNVTSTPQSTAYAQGGNTFVQTQSSSSQQTAYAVAYPAPSPQQHTYSHAQSGSLPGQQSSAHASSDNLNKSSSPKGHKSSAQATIGSAQHVSQMNEYPKPSPREKEKHKGFALEDSHDDEIALEEKVMRDSPEYNSADSHGQYYVTTDSDEEQEHSFDEPVMRFPKLNSVAFTKPERNDESTVTENSGNLQKESRNTDADENDMEAKEKEDERINSLVDRFDSEDDDLKENSLMSVDRLEKKGGVDTVETKGCDKSCQKECIETINSYRRNHGAQPLTLNQDLAMHAQAWADMKPYGHSAWAQKGLGGELIAVGSFYNTFTSAVKAWHDEEKNVDWSTGKSNGGEIKHFKQLVFQDASYLGCGKTSINGEPYYIAQMDEAAKDDQDDKRESMREPKTPDLGWYMDSSPYWKDLQGRGKIPSKIHNRIV